MSIVTQVLENSIFYSIYFTLRSRQVPQKALQRYLHQLQGQRHRGTEKRTGAYRRQRLPQRIIFLSAEKGISRILQPRESGG